MSEKKTIDYEAMLAMLQAMKSKRKNFPKWVFEDDLLRKAHSYPIDSSRWPENLSFILSQEERDRLTRSVNNLMSEHFDSLTGLDPVSLSIDELFWRLYRRIPYGKTTLLLIFLNKDMSVQVSGTVELQKGELKITVKGTIKNETPNGTSQSDVKVIITPDHVRCETDTTLVIFI